MFGLFGVLFIACDESSEDNYNLFNADTDQFEVRIGIEEETDAQSHELHSSTGQVIVGTAILNPGGGPIGTEHQLVIEVDNTWETDVTRVVLMIDSGDRGTKEYTLDRDSADAGYHQIDIQSVGEEGEVRTDLFTIQLYAEEESVTNTSENNDTGN
jgi:hypothetical protein